jgi:hypothetical protein
VVPSKPTYIEGGDTYGEWDVFMRYLTTGTTTLVSAGRRSLRRSAASGFRSWPAQAGRRLSATMSLTVAGIPPAGARVTCTASIAKSKLPTSARGYRDGSARCAWQIAAAFRGKQLRGLIAATAPWGTTSKRFARTVH